MEYAKDAVAEKRRLDMAPMQLNPNVGAAVQQGLNQPVRDRESMTEEVIRRIRNCLDHLRAANSRGQGVLSRIHGSAGNSGQEAARSQPGGLAGALALALAELEEEISTTHAVMSGMEQIA